jgi:CubicO group peptidase (beta-lactamase class C family)
MNGIRYTVFIALVITILLVGCAPISPTPASSSPTSSSSTYWPTNGWRSTTPEEQGMDSEILVQMVEHIQQEKLDINSLLVVRNGYLVNELYVSPYTADQADVLFSYTKSVIGTLVGIAIKQGYIKDVNQTMFSFLSDQGVQNLDEQKKSITLENLLTQTSGLDCHENPQPGEPYMEASDNWVQFMLNQPMVAKPGTKFNYCSGAVHLISAIIQKATEMSTREYANENLFLPLGIGAVPEEMWPSDPQGVTLGGYGLTLTPSQMIKLGYLFLNKGQWDGTTIVPAEWVEASTTSHSNQGDKKEYGYLWWVDPQGRWYAALGRAGHHVFVYPADNLVVSFTSSLPFTNDADLIPLQELLDQYILPSIKSGQPLPANPSGQSQLEVGLSALAQPEPTAPQALPAIATEISGKAYTIAENPLGWQSLIFTFQDGASEAKITLNGIRQISVGLDGTYRIYNVDDKVFPDAYIGWWVNQDTFVVKDIRLGQLQEIISQVEFSGDNISITGQEKFSGNQQYEMNGSLNQ